jgi:hypothetical protein
MVRKKKFVRVMDCESPGYIKKAATSLIECTRVDPSVADVSLEITPGIYE